jgi:hypothetical protein
MAKDKYWRPPKDYYKDKPELTAREKQRDELKRAIRELFNYDPTPEEVAGFISNIRPEITAEELEETVKLFFEQKRAYERTRR